MNFSNNELKQKISNAPWQPGCYLYKNSSGKILYVGKAKNLKKRVTSYFSYPERLENKIQQMVIKIADVEFITTDSELEAFLLETNLIKKYKPKYNSQKKDDKSYVWLMINKFEDFPQIKIVREKKNPQAEYLGPYAYTLPLKRILKELRKLFPYRTCNRDIQQLSTNNKQIKFKSSNTKPCLYYYLHLCTAPCAGLINKKSYKFSIKQLKAYFLNQKTKLINDLQAEMHHLSNIKNFEAAALLRDKIEDLKILGEKIKIDLDTDEKKYLQKKSDFYLSSLNALLTKIGLNYHEKFRIECYDISNIQGNNAVGSMIVFIDGKAAKDQYRKFKIKSKQTPDDFAMLQEVFTRRFSKKNLGDQRFAVNPDLIIVDGGKGQLSSTIEILEKKHLDFPIIGLAKKHEDIFILNQGKFSQKSFSSNSTGKFLIQRIRDEAHRFAINYHRQLRSFGQHKSLLDDIPGVGEVTKKRLLTKFHDLPAIKKASLSNLCKIIRNKTTATNLKKILDNLSVE
ncbi:MAG: excinuclease ABC subunit UvrC [bacterium]